MKKVAIFDLDRTLYNGISMNSFLFGYLIPNKKIKGLQFVKALLLIAGYLLKIIPHNTASELTMKIAAEVLEGKKISEVASWQRDFFSHSAFFEYAQELIGLLKKEGYSVMIVSAAIQPVVDACADLLSVSAVASDLKKENGIYSGGVERLLTAKAKAEVVKSYTRDTTKLLVFGDSSGDLEMLKQADHAFLFEPSEAKTRLAALAAGMTIVDRTTIIDEVKKIL